jgi:YHS domain-containing protein
MKKIISTTCFVLAMMNANAQISATNAKTKALLANTTKKDRIDPVCKMKVKADSKVTSTFEKVTYSFCAETCKKRFDTDPKKYIKK